ELEERDSARERLEQLWDEPPPFDMEEDEDAIESTAIETGGEVPVLAPGPREGQREAVQARALLEKADRLLERVSAEDRPEIEKLMERVRTALTDRKWPQVTAASNELADILFY